MNQQQLFDHADPQPARLAQTAPIERMAARDYQEEAVRKSLAFFRDGSHGVTIAQATGTGKTFVAALASLRWLQANPRRNRVLFVANRQQLVRQLQDELVSFLGLDVGVEMGGETAGDFKQITVGSLQSLGSKAKGERAFRVQRYDPTVFNWLCIFDEAHWVKPNGKHAERVLSHFKGAARLALTATPVDTMAPLFPDVAIDFPYSEAAELGWLVPVRILLVESHGVEFRALKVVSGEYKKAELRAKLFAAEELAKFADPIVDLSGSRRTLTYSPDLASMQLFNGYVQHRYGYQTCRSLHGGMSTTERDSVIEAHQAGEFRMLNLCAMLKEGYDDSEIACVAHMAPTKSAKNVIQVIGRGTRTLAGTLDGCETAEDRKAAIAASDKPECLVLDLVGATHDKRQMTAAKAFAGRDASAAVLRKMEELLRESADGMTPRQALDEAKLAEAEERRKREEERRAELAKALARFEGAADYSTSEQQVGHSVKPIFVGTAWRFRFGHHEGERPCEVPESYLLYMVSRFKDKPIARICAGELIRREKERKRREAESVEGLTLLQRIKLRRQADENSE